jgi:hypothetical protein
MTRRAKNHYYARMDTEPTTPTPRIRVVPAARVVPAVRLGRGAIAAVAALAGAVLISACGSSSTSSTTGKTNLDTARVAASIEQSVLSQRHLHATVVCPAVVPQQAGKTFECIATTKGTKAPFAVNKTPFIVTVQSNRGYVTYVGK